MIIRSEKGIWSFILGSLPNQEFNFELLKARYELLPPEIKALFSFNTEELIYDEQGLPRGILALTEWWVREFLGIRIKDYKPRIRMGNIVVFRSRSDFYKTLIHELAHTLDPKGNDFKFIGQPQIKPDILQKAYGLWLEILKQEPFTRDGEWDLLGFNDLKKIDECWAFRCGLTILIDYLIPEKLIIPSDIDLYSKLSVEQFRVFRPLSYSFFHWYIKLLLDYIREK